MRIHTTPDPVMDNVRVHVDCGGGYWLTYDSGVSLPRLVEPGLEPPIYLTLPGWVAQGLKAELEGNPVPASERHLDDAIAIRDRLLTLIEARWARTT